MNTLAQIVHLATTDEEFREAFRDDFEAALTAAKLSITAEEQAVVQESRSLLSDSIARSIEPGPNVPDWSGYGDLTATLLWAKPATT